MSKALEIWYAVKKYINLYHHQAVNEKIDVETVEDMPISIIENSLKALEIIKKQIHSLDIYKGNFYFDGERISKEEYELLMEVLK